MIATPYIAGIGLTTPLGHDTQSFWQALMHARPAFNTIDSFDISGLEHAVAGVCRDLPLSRLPERKLIKMMTRRDLLMLLAALDAWKNAGRKMPEGEPDTWGAYTGTNYMRIGEITPYFRPVRECVDGALQKFSSSEFGARLQGMINPIMAIHVLLNNGLAQVTQTLNLRGPNCCYYDFEVAGLRALVEAVRRIRAGDLAGAVCGGSYHPVDPFQYSQALVSGRQQSVSLEQAATAIKPWQADIADGTILSEAGAALVLVSTKIETAVSVRGVGLRSTYDFSLQARATALADAIQAALTDAAVSSDELGFIVGQGSGCHADDTLECEALTRILVNRKKSLSLMSPKSTLGETSEASGILSVAIATLAFAENCLPPTKNFSAASSKIPKCLHVSDQAQEISSGLALVYAFNKSGLASAVVIGK